jgi:hypothetical protein
LPTWRYINSLNRCWILNTFLQHTPDVCCSVLQYMALRCFLLITQISHCWWLVHVA